MKAKSIIMIKRIVLIALATLILIATGCKKKHHFAGEPAVIVLSIIGAPESAVLVGEKFDLDVKITPEDADVHGVEWHSSDTTVAKVKAAGNVLATGAGSCEISASAGDLSDKVVVSVSSRDPERDEMGHSGSGITDRGRDGQSCTFWPGSTGWEGDIRYEGGNNSVTYYDNGTFKASWSATGDYCMGVGYYYGIDSGINPEDMQYDCYFRHTKSGSAGSYNYIGIHGWTVYPLVEFYIVDDWFNKPVPGLLGMRKGEFTIDGDNYEIYTNQRAQQPTIVGTSTFPQYYSVRESARESGHIDVSAHFKIFESLGMGLGEIYELKYFIESGGGSGSLDCTYLFLSDGKF